MSDSSSTPAPCKAPCDVTLTLFAGGKTDCGAQAAIPLTWAQLDAFFRTAAKNAPGAEKSANGYAIFCALRPSTTEDLRRILERRAHTGSIKQPEIDRAFANGYRDSAHIVSIGALGVDYDEDPKSQPDWRPEAWPCGVLAHSTHGYDPQTAPLKWRVVLSLSRAITCDEEKSIRPIVKGRLPAHAVLRAPHQPAFLPTCPAGATVQFVSIDGPPLDVDALLAEADAQPPRAHTQADWSGVVVEDFAMPADLVGAVASIVPPLGRRHDFALTLGNILARSRLSDDAVIAFGTAAMLKGGADDHEAQFACSLNRIRVEKLGGKGWPELKKLAGGDAQHVANVCNRLETEIPGLKPTAELNIDLVAIGEASLEGAGAADVTAPSETGSRCATRGVTGPGMNTDAANARLFAERYEGAVRYCGDLGEWRVWNGKAWERDQVGEAVRRAKDTARSMMRDVTKLEGDTDFQAKRAAWAHQSNQKPRLDAMVALAQSEPGIAARAVDFDADPYLLNCENGIVDLRDGSLRQHDPLALCSRIAGAAYGVATPEALAWWDRALATWFGNDAELRDYMQRAAGYAAFGQWREKAFWFVYGPPDGGKSAFVAAIAHALGSYAESADATTWMKRRNEGGPRSDLVRLIGARLVTTVEVNESHSFDEATLKRVTGGDAVVAAPKHKADIKWHPTFALWFGANDPVRARDNDDGLWSRLRCVPFKREIPEPERDKQFTATTMRRPENASAILAWVIDGARRYLASGLGDVPASVSQASQQYRTDVSPAEEFARECLIFDAEHSTSSSDLRARRVEWCKQRPGVRLDDKALGGMLRAHGCEQIIAHGRGWKGVKLHEL